MKHSEARQNFSAIDEKQQRLESLGRLLSGEAHDFNNLLTTMIGTSEAALAQPGLDEAFADTLRCLHADAHRGAALVRQILAPPPSGAMPAAKVVVDEAVRQVAPLLRRTLGAAITLKLDLRCGDGRVLLDTSSLERILTNLATNARDAMPGGGMLSIRTHLVGTPNGKRVMINVRDTGSGIPPHILPRIFDRFFTTRPDHGGTGIGLASVRDIVCQAHGLLSVRTRLNEGTSFRIRLPGRAAGDTPHLLFVDDTALLQQLAVARFGAAGWRVQTAATVAEALAIADRAMPTVLITDQTLPDQSGLHLAEALHQRDPALPIVVISGFKVPIPDALAKIAHFLPKPFGFDELEALTRAIL